MTAPAETLARKRKAVKRWTPDEILEAKDRLLEVVGREVKLARKGRHHWGRCPFHAEKTASFNVDSGRGIFKCFGCGEGGSAIDFVMKFRRLDFGKAIGFILGREPEEEVTEEVREHRRRHAAEVRRRQDAYERERAEEDEKDRRRAWDLWEAAKGCDMAPVWRYLAGRGIDLGRLAGRLDGRTLRCQPAMDYWHAGGDGELPRPIHRGSAMLAAIVGPDGRFKGLHVTWIDGVGTGKLRLPDPDVPGAILKAKKMRGEAEGGTIRLTPPPPPGGALILAEGIETTLSLLAACPPGFAAWSAASLVNLVGGGLGQGEPHPARPGRFLPPTRPDPDAPGLVLPDGLDCRVLLAGDSDMKDEHWATAMLARGVAKFRLAGHPAALLEAPRGMDFNDWLGKS